MIREESTAGYTLGHRLGFLISYFVFTTVLYLILMLGEHNTSYPIVMGITFGIAILGYVIQRLLR